MSYNSGVIVFVISNLSPDYSLNCTSLSPIIITYYYYYYYYHYDFNYYNSLSASFLSLTEWTLKGQDSPAKKDIASIQELPSVCWGILRNQVEEINQVVYEIILLPFNKIKLNIFWLSVDQHFKDNSDGLLNSP